jgi:hypothetical protein
MIYLAVYDELFQLTNDKSMDIKLTTMSLQPSNLILICFLELAINFRQYYRQYLKHSINQLSI